MTLYNIHDNKDVVVGSIIWSTHEEALGLILSEQAFNIKVGDYVLLVADDGSKAYGKIAKLELVKQENLPNTLRDETELPDFYIVQAPSPVFLLCTIRYLEPQEKFVQYLYSKIYLMNIEKILSKIYPIIFGEEKISLNISLKTSHLFPFYKFVERNLLIIKFHEPMYSTKNGRQMR